VIVVYCQESTFFSYINHGKNNLHFDKMMIKQRYIFPNLVMIMTDLRQVVEAFGKNLHIGVLDKSKDLVDTAPLIKEMFNL
jgi:hypothetical protein